MRFRSERLLFGLARASIIALAALVVSEAHSAPIEPGEIRVIDGGHHRGRPCALSPRRLRHAGNRPRARCPAERALGAEATQRLRRIVAGGGLELRKVSCRCAPGTEGTQACNYGRLCGTLTAAGATWAKSSSPPASPGSIRSAPMWGRRRGAGR